MVNQVVLVGRLVSDPQLKSLEDGRKVANTTLALQRTFKNKHSDTYETDFIKCTLWSGIAENTAQYCKKGDTVGIKGRLAQKYYELNEEKSFSYPEVIVEKISFINRNKTTNP